ncbi:DUF881 domain-containing protein [Nocardioides sp.]|uniref:DUF881 domain-containing protein n=1 Tax=Nocardioides sp. TaxID=35761 RepID=UPI002ED4AFB1
MPGEPHARPPRSRWRLGTPLVILACGALFVTSATNSEGTDLRPGRYTDLASLVEAENQEYEELQARVQELDGDVERLTNRVGTKQVREIRQQVNELRAPAGLTPVAGPGVTVTLSDAPAEVINSSSRDIKLLVVHQQDIQAVVNAMWKGGAEALTLQGKRVITTTGIKCEGNAVMIQGIAYPQPYTISAIGNPQQLLNALDDDDYLEAYRRGSALPDVSVGWDLEVEEQLEMPGFDGISPLTYAEPIR